MRPLCRCAYLADTDGDAIGGWVAEDAAIYRSAVPADGAQSDPAEMRCCHSARLHGAVSVHASRRPAAYRWGLVHGGGDEKERLR